MRNLLTRILRTLILRAFRVSVDIAPATWQRIRTGNVIVCANHVSHLDGLLVALASPVVMVFAVDTNYSRSAWYGRAGVALGESLGLCRIVPLDENAPFGIRKLLAALIIQEPVMIFPTGTITPRAPVRRGVTWLRARTGARIVCLHIRGAERSRLFAQEGTHWWPSIVVSISPAGTCNCGGIADPVAVCGAGGCADVESGERGIPPEITR
ncbi:1-acyl-sn-glycerol-3-phosphate acyltransferase [Paraburkholderia tropica]|uniref:1-acyl-sn-glycerol-3-phosphate acyltransferase n=1 Tax=Paraburkholderia tropica TaxID=92647 RepID=UPI002AB6955D|nr:1-acyl-sn-glycerol-3-phosphate acyltransferase [Paraburkholderia tropica]